MAEKYIVELKAADASCETCSTKLNILSNWNISTKRLYTGWMYGLLFLVAYLPGATGIAQTLPVKIKGKLTNAKGEPVVNATIQAFQKEQLIGWSD